MATASQEIDYFIERQRSKLNKTNGRPVANRPRPAPAPPPAPGPPAQLDGRLDFQVARILDEPSPRIAPEQGYFPPSPRSPYPIDPFPDQQQQRTRRLSPETASDSRMAFFDNFGNYDEKRSQLKENLKREYNEYLRSQQGASKNKSTSGSVSSRSNTTRRVQFQADQTGTAPWERNGSKTTRNSKSTNDLSSSTSISTAEYITGRSRKKVVQGYDEQYIRDREEYILELYDQIRELEERKRLLEIESSKLSSSTSTILRTHYAEDLRALNNLLAERLDRRNAVDVELTNILNRPPLSGNHSLVGVRSSQLPLDQSYQLSSQRNHQPTIERQGQSYRRDIRFRPDGFQIGQDTDKEVEQAAKKRYQLELQEQMREAQMRKIQAKHETNQYDRKLETETQRYNYFGRGGGGAPMRDRDGNVVANLADLRNPQQSTNQMSHPPSQGYSGADDKIYSLGGGASSITGAPFYTGQQDQHPSESVRTGSPNHTRGAVSNGIFGTSKTDDQIMREEKYKQDLKRQIDEKRQRQVEDVARRRADDERELAKHLEWQQQMDKQQADEAARKQEKEAQERQHQQKLEEELARKRQYEETIARRKTKQQDKPTTPNLNDQDADRQSTMDDHPQELAYRSSSPPVPTIKNKGKKKKTDLNQSKRSSFDDTTRLQPSSPPHDTTDLTQPATFGNDHQREPSYRKPTPQKPSAAIETVTARKKPPSSFRPTRVIRTNSMASLRSDGSDSELLNRLEHLKRQLNDKEARLKQHVHRQRADATLLPDIEEHSAVTYLPPSYVPSSNRLSPEYLLRTTRLPRGSSPSTSDRLLRVLQNDDDDEFKPSYFRDDSILMRGSGEYISPSKRVDFVDGIFVTNLDDSVRRRRYGLDPPSFFDRENPTSMANLELGRIAEKNEHRLKKLRDLEKDDTSLMDNNEVLERFQQKQRIQGRPSLTTINDDAWLS